MPAFSKGEVWSAVDKILPHVHRMLLYGPSGTGKTHEATLSGLQDKEEVFQITLTPDTPASALIGHFIVKDQNCVWMDGVGMAAWRASCNGPARMVINEVDHAGPDAISALHVLLDDHTTAGYSLPSGEYVKPGHQLRIIGTMNGVPDDLLPSLQDRFTVRIPIQEVHPNAVATLPEDLRNAAVNTSLTDNPQRRVSIRAWHAFADLRTKLGDPVLAAKAVIGDRWKEVVDALKVMTK